MCKNKKLKEDFSDCDYEEKLHRMNIKQITSQADALNASIFDLNWNNAINKEIARIYQMRTNMTFLYKNNNMKSEILEPEIQGLIDKLQSLKR